jgi:hypothetical protein
MENKIGNVWNERLNRSLIFWIIKLREGLPKFMRGFRDGLAKNFVDFMRVSREGLV